MCGAAPAGEAFVTQIGEVPRVSFSAPGITATAPALKLEVPRPDTGVTDILSADFSSYVLPSAQPGSSLATVLQSGNGNLGGISQAGDANAALVSQTGDYNSGHVFQSGTFNSAAIYQMGNGSSGLISQSGSGNRALIYQSR